MSKRKKIKDRLDSRIDDKFIFFKLWKNYSKVCLTNLSNQAINYNSN